MKIHDLGDKLQMHFEDGVPTRIVEGYKVQLIEMKYQMAKIFVMAVATDKKITKELRKEINRVKGVRGFYTLSAGLVDNVVAIPVSALNKPDVVYGRVEALILGLKSLGIHPLDYCPLCGEKDDLDSHRIIGGMYVEVHDHCAKEFVSAASETVDTIKPNYSKLPGAILFALLMGFIGGLPAFLIYAFGNYFVGLLFAIIPFAAFWAYKKANGPKNWIAITIVSIISVIVPALYLIWLYDSIAFTYLSMTFSQALSDSEFSTAFFSDLGMSVLFSVIGIWISWNYMYKHMASSVKNRIKEFE